MQEQAETISPRHVTDANSAITRAGVDKAPFYQRPETYQSFGAFLFGLACAGPDVCSTVLPDTISKPISVILFYTFLILGMSSFFFGVYQSRPLRGEYSKVIMASVATLMVVVLSIAMLYAVSSFYQRLTKTGCCGEASPSAAPPAPLAPGFDPNETPAPPAPAFTPPPAAPAIQTSTLKHVEPSNNAERDHRSNRSHSDRSIQLASHVLIATVLDGNLLSDSSQAHKRGVVENLPQPEKLVLAFLGFKISLRSRCSETINNPPPM